MINQKQIERIAELQRQIDSYRPLDKNQANQLRNYFRIGLTYSSNALEGNTLTELETKIIIEDGLTIGGKTVVEHNEAVGHSEAYDLLWKLSGKQQVSATDILDLHRLVYYRIDQANAGIYRTTAVYISGSEFVPPKAVQVPQLMTGYIAQLEQWRTSMHPVELSALAHGGLVTIHPFIDGNGRAARLLMNLLLVQNGYPVTIIPPILRREYLATAMKYNCGIVQPLVDFIAEMVIEAQKDYLRLLKLG